MKPRKARWLRARWILPLAITAGVLAWPEPGRLPATPVLARRLRLAPTEAELRARFLRDHPGEQPLNHAIAAAAVTLHDEEPMGKFVLGLTPGKWGNDCSDFVACVVDEGLGAKARFRRDSEQHLLGDNRRLFDPFFWSPGDVAQPGDLVSVRHSPWYTPYPEACWHIGVIGSDGMVYDFTKLKRWSSARYGRQSFERFIRHSHGPRQILIQRLRSEYRYRAKALPVPQV